MKVPFQKLQDLGLIHDQFLDSQCDPESGIEYAFWMETDVADGCVNVYVLKYDWESGGPEPDRLSGEEEHRLVEAMLSSAQENLGGLSLGAAKAP